MEHDETAGETAETEPVETPEPASRKSSARKQHYVPRFYLKRFADQNGKLSVLNIPKEATYADVPYMSQCHKANFYGEDGEWETRLSSMESEWSSVTGKLINREPIAYDDANLVKQFALYQRQRTLAQDEFVKQQDASILMNIAQMELRNQPNNQHLFANNAELARACSENIRRKAVPGSGVDLLNGMESIIDDLDLTVIRYETADELLSSDVPIVAINRFLERSIGYSCMGLILFFPLTPHDLVVIYDGNMYSAHRGQLYATSGDENEVEDLNVFQYISAETIVFAQKRETLAALGYAHPETKQERHHSRGMAPISTFGPENGEHVIQVSTRKTYHECNLSFAPLRREARRIPIECREAVPRTRDEKWSQKLSTKESVLVPPPQMAIPSMEYSRSDRKKLRRGYQRMSRFAEQYWNERSVP